MARDFAAAPPDGSAEVPLLIGVCGPPGGGKSFSSLRLATGIQRVRPGPIVVIDTESGRVSKYHKSRGGPFDFLAVDFQAPYSPDDFLAAIKQQLADHRPACIIVDSISDEHEGPGGVLDWHDDEVPKSGGNDWAAWKKPKAARKRLVSGMLRITTPLLFTFRAREKTATKPGSKIPEKLGWTPIAPAEIVHAIDLFAILPPRADGVPVWKSEKVNEDFTIKLPDYFREFIADGAPLDERMGEAFARWARGEGLAPAAPAVDPDEYLNEQLSIIERAADARQLHGHINADRHRTIRRQLPAEMRDRIVKDAGARIAELKAKETTNDRDAEGRDEAASTERAATG